MKTLNAISPNNSVLLSFRHMLEIKSICRLVRGTRERGMEVFTDTEGRGVPEL